MSQPVELTRKNRTAYPYGKQHLCSNVECAVVAPWVGDSGLGIQYKLPKPIMWYVEQGILIPK